MFGAILTSMLVTALVLMLGFPHTPTGKWLRRVLVEAPGRFVMEFRWAKFGRALLVAGAVALFALMPEMTLLMAVSGLDAAALLEVMLIVWLASVSGSLAGAWRAGVRFATNSLRRVRAFKPRNRARAPRRKHRPRRKTDNEDVPGGAFA